MSFARIAGTLDPNEYVIAPPVAALDEFRMTDEDGSFVAQIDESFIDKFVNRMNEREQLTGDLCPLVIGHTPDASEGYVPETNQPPIVGFARSWFKAPLGNTGRYAAYFTPWVRKDRVQLAKDHPRRSCEVWVSRYEADPISLLGATTPARDLGLMKLSRNGSLNVLSPGDPITMEPKNGAPGAPPADPKESGPNKDLEGKIDALAAQITQLVTLMSGQAGGAPGAPGAAPAPAGAPPGAPGADLDDAAFEQMMKELGMENGEPSPDAGAAPGGQSPPMQPGRKGDEPVKNMGSPGGNAGNTHVTDPVVKNSRIEEENRDLKIRLSRIEVERTLEKINAPEIASSDGALVSDLIALPPDVRARMIERLTKLSRPASPRTDGLDAATGSANGNPADAGKKRLSSLPADQARDEKERITKLARSKNQTFEAAARECGYEF